MLLLVALPGTASAHHQGAPSPAAVVARAGLVRRADLGRGWTQTNAAPHSAAALTCTTDRAVRASLASPTWSSSDTTEFVSGTSYGFAGPAQQQAAWRATGTGAMGRCLKRQFAEGSSHGVRLVATGIRRISAPRSRALARSATLRAYQLSGTASGAGQDISVTLDVVLVGHGTWIGEDEFSAAGSAVSAALQARVAELQARRAG